MHSGEQVLWNTLRPNGPTAKVVAYANDVTIFIMSPADVPIIHEALRNYEAASGARVNISKSKVITVGPWDTSLQIMGIPYYNEAKILGFHITNTVNAPTEPKLGDVHGGLVEKSGA